MPIAQSKLTAQGQISVPAGIRRKLGLGPGSVLEWDEINNEIVVRKAGCHTSAEVHAALFGERGRKRAGSAVDTRRGIRKYIRRKHARR